MDLSKLYTVLNPINYFDTREQRTSWRTYGQIFKDSHDLLGHTLSNLEMIQRSPYIMGSLLKKGTRLTLDSLRRSLNGYFHRMSASGEFNHVSLDLAHLLLNFQRSQDNHKLIIGGELRTTELITI